MLFKSRLYFMHALLVCSSPSWALDASVCSSNLCPSQSICRSGIPQYATDPPGDAYSHVGWRSQVYGSMERTIPSYCFFRAIRIDNLEKDLLPLYWQPGGISYDGEPGKTSGCLVICSSSTPQLKPSANAMPIDGFLYAGLTRPKEKDAPSWGPDGGWSVITKTELTDVTAALEPQVDTAILYNGADKSNFTLVNISAALIGDHVIRFDISNTGKTKVGIRLNTPINSSMLSSFTLLPPTPFHKRISILLDIGITLNAGASLHREMDVRSEDADKGVTALPANSQARVSIDGVGSIAVAFRSFASSNGSYPEDPASFMMPQLKK